MLFMKQDRMCSTAVQHNLTVVTENVKHLGRIPGIKIENWIVRDK